MKRLFFCISLVLLVSTPVFSETFRETPEAQQEEAFIQYKEKDVHIGIGLEVWEAYWEPIWRSFLRYEATLPYLDPAYLPYNYGTYRVDPLFLYLPYFSMRIENMGFKINAAYGETEARMQTFYYLPTATQLGMVKYRRNIKHYDGEALFTLHFKKYLTFYAGPKFKIYDISEKMEVYNVSILTGYLVNTPDLFIYQVGGTAGVSLKLHFAKLFNLEARAAGIVFLGEENYTGPLASPEQTFSYGFDATAFFNCRIPIIRATLSLGFRYQYLKYHESGNYSYRSDYDRALGSSAALKFHF